MDETSRDEEGRAPLYFSPTPKALMPTNESGANTPRNSIIGGTERSLDKKNHTDDDDRQLLARRRRRAADRRSADCEKPLETVETPRRLSDRDECLLHGCRNRRYQRRRHHSFSNSSPSPINKNKKIKSSTPIKATAKRSASEDGAHRRVTVRPSTADQSDQTTVLLSTPSTQTSPGIDASKSTEDLSDDLAAATI